jgi:hypothetical protein
MRTKVEPGITGRDSIEVGDGDDDGAFRLHLVASDLRLPLEEGAT